MKIICIGRNYSEHAKELKNELPKEPLFFLKPDTAIVIRNRPFFYPEFSKEVHYEAELVYRICKVGKYIQEKFAHTYYDEIALGIDFTARDLQREAQAKGTPWEKAKGFDRSAPVSSFYPISEFANIKNLKFSLNLNGEMVQQGNSADMIFSIDRIIEHVSQFITLKMGDIIFTGTPAGVGPVKIGDRLEGFIEGKKVLSCNIR